jgi:hypothetical protein
MKPILEPIDEITVVNYHNVEKKVKSYTIESLSIEHENATLMNAFALRFSGDKDNGTYVEIGSSHWLRGNNTYMLEKEFGWTGVGIDIKSHYVDEYNKNRSNPCVQADAKSFNWDKYFEKNNFPNQIDYLSIDVDNGNYLSLLNMPLSRYRFTTIIIENRDVPGPISIPIHEEIKDILLRYNYTFIGSGFNDDFWIDNTYLKLIGNQYDQISSSFWRREIKI